MRASRFHNRFPKGEPWRALAKRPNKKPILYQRVLEWAHLGSNQLSALQASLPAVEELARDIEPHYRLELT